MWVVHFMSCKARTLDVVLAKCSVLPLGLHIEQDNTSREGQNQYILRFGVMLVLLGVFRWLTFGFLRTGHSHDNIDQLFAQVVSAIRHAKFDCSMDVVEVLGRLCRRRDMKPSKGQSENGAPDLVCAHASQLGEVACWREWGGRLAVEFAGHALRGYGDLRQW